MSIRTKCALLILAFEITLCVTLLLTLRLIGGYFDDAARAFAESSTVVAELSRLRTLARNQLTLLPAADAACEHLAAEMDETQRSIVRRLGSEADPALIRRFEQRAERRRSAVAAYLLAARHPIGAAPVRFDPAAHLDLDESIRELLDAARTRVDQPFAAQRKAALLLSLNAVVGLVLGVIGLLLVRRWVLEPIQDLSDSAAELGRGNLDHRAPVRSGDEFGRLAGAVNRMSADLARLERQMIQRERMSAMGELIAYVAHNIRNPLAGIQAAADAARRHVPPESPIRAHQDAIVSAVERFQIWLRQLERVCAPMQLQPAPTDVGELVANTAAVFRPMVERRAIVIDVRIAPQFPAVMLDPRYFEQAVAAVLGNAIEASADGRTVRVAIEAMAEPLQWELSVADEGAGIPAEVIDRIFEPSFSTKKSGHGLGLAMVKRIVDLHGGQVWAECPASGGTVVRMRMPG